MIEGNIVWRKEKFSNGPFFFRVKSCANRIRFDGIFFSLLSIFTCVLSVASVSVSFACLSLLVDIFRFRRYQQEVEGQTQSTAAWSTRSSANTNTIHAGSYIPASAPQTVQGLSQPVKAPSMAQQQRQNQLSDQPQLRSGIPSYPSQIEGLSVSQAAVNDVLVDLQSKVINETIQQYHDESASGAYLGKNK